MLVARELVNSNKVLAYTYKSEKYVYANNALCKYISNSEGRSVKASYREYVYIEGDPLRWRVAQRPASGSEASIHHVQH